MTELPQEQAEIFRRACALHRQLQLQEAEILYRQTLDNQPRNADAWHQLGILAQQTDRAESAVELVGRAIEIAPRNARFHNSLGNALLALARLEPALASFDAAIALRPNYIEALYNRGNVQYQMRRFEPAIADYDQALALRADHADSFNNRGLALAALGRLDDALESYGRALVLRPAFAAAYCNRGNAQLGLNREEAAILSYDLALAADPQFPQAYINRCVAQRRLGLLEAALASADLAIAIQPAGAEAHANRALALLDLQRWNEAKESLDRAIALQPRYAEAYYNRGSLLILLNFATRARADLDTCLALRPDFLRARFNRAVALLLAGEFDQGWREYEARWEDPDRRDSAEPRIFTAPQWSGEESLAGKKILLFAEQGLGDTIHFCRYVPLVAALGAQVILEAPQALSALLGGLAGITQLIAQGDALPPFDYRCPLMSLPLAFGTTMASIPATVPYLRADVARTAYWQAKLGPRRGWRVGLVWSGGLWTHLPEICKVQQRRNIPLAKLATLADSGVEFFSLQKGEAAETELARLKAQGWRGPDLKNFTAELHDFADTAALIEQLDLVISVDTSTAHLAGALGKPVWILNRFDTCWRWLLDRTDSPWYPGARLYRQPSPGDWDSVVHKVKADLEALCS